MSSFNTPDESVQDTVAQLINQAANTDVVYNDANDTLTVSLTDSVSVNTLEADTINNADVANAPANSVPKAQGDGTLSFGSIDHVVVEAVGQLGSRVANTWNSVASLGTARNSFAAAEANGLIYAIGGDGNNTVEEYDPSTDTWSSVASFSTTRNDHAAAEANGLIYAIGGDTTSVEEYDPSTDTWSSVASLNTSRRYHAASSADGNLYALGGDGPLASVEEYDPSTDTWSSVASMNTKRARFTAAEANGLIYAIGGQNPEELASVEEYDPSTDTWSSVASMNTKRIWHRAAAAYGNIYAIGGESDFTTLASVEEYDPSTDTWSSVASLGTERQEIGAAATEDFIYATGGKDSNSTTLASVEELDFDLSPEDVFTANGDTLIGIDDPNGKLLNRTTGREVTNGTQLAQDGETIAAATEAGRVYRTEET